MSSHRSERHEETLAELLASPEAGAAFEATPLGSCATCRALVREHLELARRLDALGRAEREDVQVAMEASAPAAGAAEDALRRQVRAISREGEGFPRIWVAAGVAAALALIVWLRLPRTPPDPGPLLGSGLELLHPVNEVGSFAPFRWNDEGPGTGWYRVLVFPEASDGDPSDSGPLREKVWNPEPELVERWGDSIHWRLELYSGAGAGDLVDSVGAWARLSPR